MGINKLVLTRMWGKNFKGAKNFDFSFDKENFIFGKNGSGKTTILDAYLFVFFGEDSAGSSKFNIITIDPKTQKPKKKVEAEVEIHIKQIDEEGNEFNHVFNKVHRQLWKKVKGEEVETYKGNENVYSYNGVPMAEKIYAEKVSAVIKKDIFKMVSDVTFFTRMDWKDQRSILISLIPEVKDSDIVKLDEDFQILQKNVFDQKKTFEEFKAESKATKKKASDENDLIPARIDETSNMIIEEDFESVEKLLSENKSELESVEKTLSSGSEGLEDLKKKINQRDTDLALEEEQLSTLKKSVWTKLKNEKEEASRVAEEFYSKYEGLDSEKKTKSEELLSFQDLKVKAEGYLNVVRAEWIEENNQKPPEVDDSETKCFHCDQYLPEGMLNDVKEQSKISFNNKKAEKLRSIEVKAEETKKKIAKYEEDISAITARIDQINEELNKKGLKDQSDQIAAKLDLYKDMEAFYASKLEENPIYLSKVAEIDRLKAIKFDEVEDTESDSKQALIDRKEELKQLIEKNNKVLSAKETNEKCNARISELESRQKKLTKEIADMEKIENLILRFERAKMDKIEKEVNKLFSFISFRLFEDLKLGGQKPNCEAMINGVPFKDANTASKINAGVDIINVLSRKYNTITPVFIDNRESVTEIIETDSQLISLVVDPSADKIRISHV